MRSYRYSRWDGTQESLPVDGEDLMDAMADDLASHGDFRQALRNLMQRGMEGRMGSGFEGIREMIERLKQQSQERLERYNLASLVDELKKRLDEIVEQEKEALRPQRAQGGDEAPDGDQAGAEAENGSDQGEAPAASNAPGSQGGQSGGDNQRRRDFMKQLPEDFAGRVKALQAYDFFDSDAQQAFNELMEVLKQQAMGNAMRDMAQRFADMSPEERQRLKEMIADLNSMLDQQVWGEQPDFNGFMQKYGDMFGPNPPQSLEELTQQMASRMAQMQSLFNSLPESLRQELQDMLSSAFEDQELAAELAELQANLDFFSADDRPSYEFSGDADVPLEQAMQLMDELQKVDAVQQQLEDVGKKGSLEDVDAETLEAILGPEGRQELEKLRELERRLEEAGYLKRNGDRLEMTSKGVRKIGSKVLHDIFNRLKIGRHGGPRVDRRGIGIEARLDTKAYEFGDHFSLDLQQSLMKAVQRQGKGAPVRVLPEDFEVYREENLNQCSTVLMLDQSRSMGLNAKKVALALHSLIKMQYPKDSLYVIGFAEYASELLHEDIPTSSWGSYYPGTNMHHALMIARRLLSRSRHGQRQVLMVTDGEPTAHLEQNLAFFNYPPTWRTIEQTLQEVKRCTREGIVINTFMMEQDPYLMRFVQEITKINRGRAFFSSPRHLGQYVVTDYLNNKRRRRIA